MATLIGLLFGGITAAIASVLALVSYFASAPSLENATDENFRTVMGDSISGDKIEGITLEQYEAGLKRPMQMS